MKSHPTKTRARERARGRRTAVLTSLVAVLLSFGAMFGARSRIVEEYLLWRMRSADPMVRWDAAARLGALGSRRAIEQLLVSDDEGCTEAGILNYLDAHRAKAIKYLLFRDGEKPRVVSPGVLARTVGWMEDDCEIACETADAVKSQFSSPSLDTRLWVILVTSVVCDRAKRLYLNIISQGLVDEEREVRLRSASAAASCGRVAKALTDRLVGLFEKGDTDEKRAAAWAMSQTDPQSERVSACIESGLHAADPYLREDCARAMESIRRSAPAARGETR